MFGQLKLFLSSSRLFLVHQIVDLQKNKNADGGAVCILNNRVLFMPGGAVMVQCSAEQEGAEHAALGCSGVDHQSRGGVAAKLNRLVWSEGAQYLVA